MSDESTDDLRDQLRAQRARIAELEAQVASMDSRALQLEQEVATRGVKLNCARIALERAKIAFDETSKSREEAVQNIAHDLRTPLTSIKGAARNVLDGVAGPVSERVHAYAEIIEEQSDRLIGTVNWLVQAMRMQTESLRLSDAPVDLSELVERRVRALSTIALQKDIELQVRSCPAQVDGDPEKLQRVIDNLVGNALKFTDRGGHVEVAMECDFQELRVRVKDDGIGMSDEVREHIFDRYFRNPESEGSGLGLVISRQVVRLHGGDISVKSEAGVGSELTVHLPRAARR